VGVALDVVGGIGNADLCEELGGAPLRVTAAHPPMRPQGLPDLESDRADGVQRGERVLEDHRYPASADPSHLRLGQRCQVDVAEPQRSALAGRPGGQQAQQRQRGHRLAGAGLTDKRGDLARVEQN